VSFRDDEERERCRQTLIGFGACRRFDGLFFGRLLFEQFAYLLQDIVVAFAAHFRVS
jgi:hypothetical protein